MNNLMALKENESSNETGDHYENINANILKRAAEISKHIHSTTLGPNSSFNSMKETINTNGNHLNGHEKKPKSNLKENKSPKVSTDSNSNIMDINDLKYLQQQIHERQRDKQIEVEVRRKLEEKRREEIERYKLIQEKINDMRKDAELRHQLKIEELERKIEYELELENQKEKIYQEQRKELAVNARKKQEEIERQLQQQVRKYDEFFATQESQFIKLIQICNPEMGSVDSYKNQFRDIKNARENHKTSFEVIKNATIKLDELCQNLHREITEFEIIRRSQIAQQQEAEEQQKKIQAELDAQAAQHKIEAIIPKQIALVQPQPNQDQIDQVPSGDTANLQRESFRLYNQSKQLLITKKNQTKLLDETPELQQIRFALKLAINNSINFLNEQNRSTLLDGYQKLFNLLSGQRINTSKGNVSITDHNEASDWCKLRIAEKLIDRCDKEPSLIFYAASTAIALWQKFPDFGEIFKALLFKECPFLIPFKPPKLNNQSNEEFLSSWGFRLNNGVCENHVYYEGRTTKFAALLAALWITFPRRGDNLNPFGIENAWIYFSNILNNSPDANYLHVIGKLLEIAGFMMLQVYGNQFVKIMMVLRDNYLPAVHSDIDEETSASFNRLRDSVMKFFSENKFAEPKGRLGAGYW